MWVNIRYTHQAFHHNSPKIKHFFFPLKIPIPFWTPLFKGEITLTPIAFSVSFRSYSMYDKKKSTKTNEKQDAQVNKLIPDASFTKHRTSKKTWVLRTQRERRCRYSALKLPLCQTTDRKKILSCKWTCGW